MSVAARADESGDGGTRLDEDFVHYTCPTLPHLIALLCRPSVGCIPQNTSLVVVDSLSTLVNHAFPRIADSKPITLKNGTKGDYPLSPRRQVAGSGFCPNRHRAGFLQQRGQTQSQD